MKSQKQLKHSKKGTSHRKKVSEPSEFQSKITLDLDEFFRYFNYYYPGKNKEQIINKCITGNAYWITVDSQYYSEDADLEINKITQLRQKSALKNGVYPPTKDSLEEQKFILMIRKMITANTAISHLLEIKRTSISTVIQYLEETLANQEVMMTEELEVAQKNMETENNKTRNQLQALGIPLIKSARLFAYEKLEKEMINELVEKARQKESQARCDFCFTRDKQIVKCKNCQLYAHPLCFAKIPKNGQQFECDQCEKNIPENAQCQLCPLIGGNFLELLDDSPVCSYRVEKGESALRFKIAKKEEGQRKRQFIHISCFVLHPECSYNVKQGKVEGIHYIDRTRKNTSICLICGNMIGMTVPCTNQSCRRAYHPECAKRNNLKINVIKANNKSLLEIYCERHKKPQSYEYLNDSVSNRIKELKKFYDNLDHEIKRHGNNHNQTRQKRPPKVEENLKYDCCLVCSNENNYQAQIINCRKCYGWRHSSCGTGCPLCDI